MYEAKHLFFFLVACSKPPPPSLWFYLTVNATQRNLKKNGLFGPAHMCGVLPAVVSDWLRLLPVVPSVVRKKSTVV